MYSIGLSELIIIVVAAMVLLGPKEVLSIIKKMKSFLKILTQYRRNLETVIEDELTTVHLEMDVFPKNNSENTENEIINEKRRE